MAETTASSVTSPASSREEDWRKDRFISAATAVDRLEPHVDVIVALPDPRVAFLPRIDRWMADPKDVSWSRDFGVRRGVLKLVHRDEMLIITFGLVTFDGCGGTDLAIPTNVGDRPALLIIAAKNEWSQIVWPMRPLDQSGTYGLAGTLEGWEALALARSMEAARQHNSEGPRGC